MIKFFLFILVSVSSFSVLLLGCDESNNSQVTQALTENDFEANPNLRANPEAGVVATFLEFPGVVLQNSNQTGVQGIDRIPHRYKRTLDHEFCFEDDFGGQHSFSIEDAQGAQLLTVTAGGPCVMETIPAGTYDFVFEHDGIINKGTTIFSIPQDLEAQANRGGYLDKLHAFILNALGMEFTETSHAQSDVVNDNAQTLLSTNACLGCNLVSANLDNADLEGTNLMFTDLTSALMRSANLNSAMMFADSCSLPVELCGTILDFALLDNTTFQNADMRFAQMTAINGPNTDFTGANLTSAQFNSGSCSANNDASICGSQLVGTLFDNADLTNANLNFATLTNASFSGTTLSGTDFNNALWIDGQCGCANAGCTNCM